jgi:hypothetical protein
VRSVYTRTSRSNHCLTSRTSSLLLNASILAMPPRKSKKTLVSRAFIDFIETNVFISSQPAATQAATVAPATGGACVLHTSLFIFPLLSVFVCPCFWLTECAFRFQRRCHCRLTSARSSPASQRVRHVALTYLVASLLTRLRSLQSNRSSQAFRRCP